MIVTRAEHSRILRWRQQFLATPDGRRTLKELLANLSLFVGADEMLRTVKAEPGAVNTIIQGIGLLEQMHVWTADNFDRLLEKMNELPMPTIKEDMQHGETAR